MLSTKVGRVLIPDASAPKEQHSYVDVLPFSQHWDYSAAGVRRKFYEVTKQLVLTNHLVDGIFIAISNKSFNAMNAAQKQKVTAAAQAAAAYNNENRIKEESQIVDFFKQQGLQVTTPDLEAFRKTVQTAYQNSEYAKVWPKGLVDRINNTK